ncbi:MAG: DUF2071 domain-containing protein [Verrucomicrobia bacterium]|nr:DUF2071 domain-containing protein [Verrucomicrobiota bacterium]
MHQVWGARVYCFVEEWIQRQLRERQQPVGRSGVMFQGWRRLLFLHWMVDPEIVQHTLPRGLSVDTYDGMAWIGIVPFRMSRVRPAMLPLLSKNFLELNLRTYVKDHRGAPGVWFYSLDANDPFAVWTARLFFGLPYVHAKMHVEDRDDEIRYSCRRCGSSTLLEYRFRPAENTGEAKLGSLEFFLIERYRLFAFRRGRLLTGRVYHPPYELRNAIVSKYDKDLFELDGLHSPSEPPNNVLYSPRVDVTVYPVEVVR